MLVWQAATRDMNATVPQRVIDEAMEEDPARAAAEYGAQFRSDVEAFINREVVQACVSTGTYERAPLSSGTSYKAFLDFAGGSGGDTWRWPSVTRTAPSSWSTPCARSGRRSHLSSPSRSSCILLKGYRIYTVEGDAYGGEFAREPLKKHGISYQLAKKPKSDLYAHHSAADAELRPRRPARSPARIQQIIGLECHTARAGRDKIDHPPGGHDDLANAVAGLVARAAGSTYSFAGDWVDGPDKPPDDPKERQQRVNKLVEALKRGEPVPF